MKGNDVVNKKANLMINDLLARENYLVVQANDLAKAFGGLTSFQHKILDFAISFVKADSTPFESYDVQILSILHHLGLNSSGQNYKRVAEAFKSLNENTALYFKIMRPNGKIGVRMTQLFSRIDMFEDGSIRFKFSEDAAPYIFDLRKNFYSFKLSELATIKSKYSLIMMKLWEANKMGNEQNVTISGSLEDWESWFLGKDTRWPAGKFGQKALDVAIKELTKKLGVWFTVTKQKRGRSIVGYEITIHGKDTKRSQLS